MLLLYRYNFE
jgi:hypothetical protein